VVAHHCGYRAMELNASDDRSAEALREVIGRATNGNTITNDKRPNCIILDEIDGIDGRAPIDALIQIIKAPLSTSRGVKGKKSTGTSLALTRPLICICNDLFAPQLRELRQFAQVFAFSSPTEIRLVQRLRAVCAAEGIAVPPAALTALCHATGNDIRSSINTLQFAALKTSIMLRKHTGQSSVSLSAHSRDVGFVLGSMISSGLKDADKDILQIWNEALSLKDAARSFVTKAPLSSAAASSTHVNVASNEFKSASSNQSGVGRSAGAIVDVETLKEIRTARVAKENPVGGSKSGTNSGFATKVVESVADFGDNQLVITGLFENYLGSRYHDPSLLRTSTACDWFSDADLFLGKMGDVNDSHQSGIYVSVVAGAIHSLCASESRPSIQWPKKVRPYLRCCSHGAKLFILF
jgi:hypothetical protein